MKTPEEIERLRAISSRLKELGYPTKDLDKRIDKEEGKSKSQK